MENQINGKLFSRPHEHVKLIHSNVQLSKSLAINKKIIDNNKYNSPGLCMYATQYTAPIFLCIQIIYGFMVG